MNVFEIQNRPDCTIVHLFGQIDAAVVQEVKPLLQEKIPANCVHLVIDLEKVDFLDSHGIGLFVTLLRKVHGNNGSLIFAGAEGQPASVLQMVGFSRPYVSFCNDTAQALDLCKTA